MITDTHEFTSLEEALDHYRRRPRDVVPKTPYTGSNRDLAAMDGKTVEVIRYEFGDHGVTEVRTCETITSPIVPEGAA